MKEISCLYPYSPKKNKPNNSQPCLRIYTFSLLCFIIENVHTSSTTHTPIGGERLVGSLSLFSLSLSLSLSSHFWMTQPSILLWH